MIKIGSRVKILNSIAFKDMAGVVEEILPSLPAPILVKIEGFSYYYFSRNELEVINEE